MCGNESCVAGHFCLVYSTFVGCSELNFLLGNPVEQARWGHLFWQDFDGSSELGWMGLEVNGTVEEISLTGYITLNSHENSFYIKHIKPEQNGFHFKDILFKCILIHIHILQNFVPKSTVNKRELVQIITWHGRGPKPLSEPITWLRYTYMCMYIIYIHIHIAGCQYDVFKLYIMILRATLQLQSWT